MRITRHARSAAILLAAALLMQPATDPPVDWDKEFGVEEKVRDPATGDSRAQPGEASPARVEGWRRYSQPAFLNR